MKFPFQSTLLTAAMFIAAAAASTKTEMRPRRSPAPAPVPIPPSPLQEFSMDNYNDEISTDAYNDQDFSTDTYNDAWQDQTMTYDVVLLDSGRSTSSEEERAERGREILLQGGPSDCTLHFVDIKLRVAFKEAIGERPNAKTVLCD